MAQREIKPFKVTEQQIENYQFTKKQIAAYAALKKAQERCKKSGLSLMVQQFNLVALPTKYYMNDMTTVDFREATKGILVPVLCGVGLSDSGADDSEYMKDTCIK